MARVRSNGRWCLNVTLPATNRFDRSKQFYPLIRDFLAGVYGWNTLWARAIGLAAVEAQPRGEKVPPPDAAWVSTEVDAALPWPGLGR